MSAYYGPKHHTYITQLILTTALQGLKGTPRECKKTQIRQHYADWWSQKL